MSKRLNILYLSPRFPYPLVGGDRVKNYNILKHLTANHNVTLITLYQGGKCPQEHKQAILDLGIDLKIIDLDPFQAGMRAGALTLAGYPLEIGYYNNPMFSMMVEKVLKTQKIDLIYGFFLRTAEYFKNSELPRIMMAEDCRIIYQKRSYQESTKLYQKIIRWWEYKKLLKYEAEVVENFDVTTFVSKNDIESIKSFNPVGNYKLLTNGVDISQYSLPEYSYRNDILFAGKLDIWANVLMVNQIVEQILPQVWKKFPNVKFNIVGSKPPKSIKKLQGKNINIIPDVPSLIPYYQKAAIFLHPHSGGSGIQNKLLEAMACGCPVLTTQTGIQGIDVVDGESVYLANSSEQFIEKTIYMLKNPDEANKIGLASHQVIIDTHSWESIYKDLDVIINDLMKSYEKVIH